MSASQGLRISFPPRRILGPVDPDGLPAELSGVSARMGRAQETIETMHAEINEWWRDNDIEIERRANNTLTEHEWFAIVPEAPLERWGLMAGEVLLNIHASLDNALYAAAKSVTNLEEPSDARKLAFPNRLHAPGLSPTGTWQSPAVPRR